MTGAELYTRCPTCKTVFRTHDAQLAMQSGRVRCGQCRMVFDGRAHLVDLMPERSVAVDDEREYGPPTVTLRTSDALEPVATERHAAMADDGVEETGEHGDTSKQSAPEGAEREPADPLAADTATRVIAHPATGYVPPETDAAASSDAPAGAAQPTAGDDVVRYDWRQGPPRKTERPAVRWALRIAAVVLVLLLAGQAVFQFRHAIAANFPQLRPNLVVACAAVGCTIDPVRRRDEITIESHDLQADPAHQGLLILQVTLRNHAASPVAFPYLDLEILDLAGQAQVRRALAPVEYAGGAADFTRGMPANAEWNVKLFIDASGIAARGYNLDLFYP
jgi:predicted Zn finger-like uncharacterized protein